MISFTSRTTELLESLRSCRFRKRSLDIEESEAIQTATAFLFETKNKGGIVYTIGNGGSGATASHFHLELVKNLRIPSLLLSDAHLMTSIANDLAFDQIYSTPLETMFTERDLLIALSVSGKSPNILRAIETAQKKMGRTITFTGGQPDNPMAEKGNLNFWANSTQSGLIETIHFFQLHTIIDFSSVRLNQ